MKAIIFDFGGTLDTNGIHWSEFFWDVYKKFNVGVSKEEYERAYVEGEKKIGKVEGLFRDVLFRQLSNQFKYLGSHSPLKSFGDKLRGNDNSKLIERMADYCYNAVIPNLQSSKELLSSLHKNFKLGLISNFYGNVASVCREFGIDEFLDVIVDSAVAGISKPDPAIFKLALKELNLSASDCMMVGDSYSRDIAPAKSIGFTTVWLRGKSWNEREDNSQADFVIKDLGVIRKLIETQRA